MVGMKGNGQMAQITRREFLAAAGSAAAFSGYAFGEKSPYFWEPNGAIRKPRFVDPDKKLNIALIGAAGRGHVVAMEMLSENFVALCDVDPGFVEQYQKKDFLPTTETFPKAARYKDYRKMFAEMADQIDAVIVATPDHTHFPAAMMAIAMGKHVYCEKPLTRTIWEARQLTQAARKAGVATQMGNHRHALDNLRILREWLEAGAIGAVRDVHLWTDRPNKRHFAAIGVHGLEARPTDRPPVPEGMDWNLWLGTRPERPYHPLYAPVQWRSWYDFGTGSLGDMGCHIFDGPFWSLQLGYPESVEAEVSNRNDETFPKWSIITYRFPARGAMPPVKLVWYDGGKLPPRPKQLEAGRNLQVEGGQLYYGDKGAIMTGSYANACRLIPETAMKEYGRNRPAATYPRSVGHFKEWIEACKGGPSPRSNFDYAGVLTEVVLLGVLAVRTGKKIECDPKTGRILNLPEDHPYIRPGFRKF